MSEQEGPRGMVNNLNVRNHVKFSNITISYLTKQTRTDVFSGRLGCVKSEPAL